MRFGELSIVYYTVLNFERYLREHRHSPNTKIKAVRGPTTYVLNLKVKNRTLKYFFIFLILLLFRHQDHNNREWMIYNTTKLWFGLRVDLIVGFFSGIVIFTSILLNDSTGEVKVTSLASIEC